MIYFDKRTLEILRYIKKCGDKGAKWIDIQRKFKDDAPVELLMSFTKELYTETLTDTNEWIGVEGFNKPIMDDYHSFSTPKANELIEKKIFDFWKWIIPTLISVAALVVSVIACIK